MAGLAVMFSFYAFDAIGWICSKLGAGDRWRGVLIFYGTIIITFAFVIGMMELGLFISRTFHL